MQESGSLETTTGAQARDEVGRLGRWALRLAPVAILLQIFAATSRIPLLYYGGLIVAILLAVAVFLLSAFTLAKKDPPVTGVWRTVYLVFVVGSVLGGLLMFRLLIHGLEASGAVI